MANDYYPLYLYKADFVPKKVPMLFVHWFVIFPIIPTVYLFQKLALSHSVQQLLSKIISIVRKKDKR